jgi:hypothetical protein
MATRIEPFSVTVAAGTTQAAFQRTALRFDQGTVTQIDVRVPPGAAGLVGFRIAHSNQSVLPYKGNTWFVMDNDKAEWHLESFPDGDGWELWAYNLDLYAHTVYVWFYVTEIGRPLVPTIQPIQIAQIAQSEVEPPPEEEQ